MIPMRLQGKYGEAYVFTHNVDPAAISQIIELCNQEFVKDSQIRIMPDTHAGAGCTIGTTMTIKDKIVPNLVGVDIGCGMETVTIRERQIDLLKLDHIIHTKIPSGFNVRSTRHEYAKNIDLSKLRCKDRVDIERAYLSIGTLGGGNHFIELNKDDDGNLFLVVHSGSRHLGKQIADYYQNLAYEKLQKSGKTGINKALAYVEGQDFEDYLHDMNEAVKFASINRKAIANTICNEMDLTVSFSFETIHNYINTSSKILRKGAISAYKDEIVLIPINMLDGSLICIGKGNPEWNYSAPHGAGRIMSRRAAKENISLGEFVAEMRNVFSTTVNESTLDEAPMAYKPMQEIMENIKDTVHISSIIKPIYNFKAAGD